MEKNLADLLISFFRSLSLREFLRELRGTELRRINEALDDKRLCPIAREMLEERLTATHMRHAMGLCADRAMREKLRDLIRDSAGELRQGEVALASPRLILRKGRVVPDFDPAHTLPMHAATATSLIVAYVGILLLMSPSFLEVLGMNIRLVESLALMVFGLGLALLGLFLVRETEPQRAAHRIAGTLEKFQRDML